ncbi:hypothetical protein AMATHDRAFT_148375 [Amanita thiersii Skay4041]|uniref:Cytochrome P450 n=1 Tax=Amanita thiersii Skay4041 TaxID=703135 RepID=A0A2A9NN27_9AGAR|nr:hypothetical protein AMATHDRAFT_148375 [Amanita thiersii Skay4041]
MGYTHNLGLMPYDDQWRRHRRVFHENFHDDAIFQYHPTLMRETHTFLHDLLSSADNLAGRIRYLFGAEILDIVYGIRLDGPDDPYLLLIEEVAKGFDYATRSGIFLVEVIPAMKYIPKWFPGASFQRSAAHYKKMATLAQNKPFNHAKRALVDGTAKPSIVTRMIQAMADDLNRESEETTIRQVLSVAYSCKFALTSAAFEAFFVLMSKHPEVQKKAHAELEAVVGPDRLPTFEDRESLHYINAIIRELLRWMPVAPLGLPHLSTEADVYDGYFIPEGTAVFGNLWAILRDPEMYPNPAQFQPERYLKDGRLNLDGVLDPFSVVFGFGRRICPGKAFAEGAIYITVTAVLATFDILPPLDDNGQSIELSTDGAVVQPISCKCIVKPRSKAAADLIRACVAQDVT